MRQVRVPQANVQVNMGETNTLTPRQQHRRQVRNQIVLPMLGVAAGLILLLVVVGQALNAGQVSLVADFMLTLFYLLPMMLTCLIPTLIMIAAAVGLWKATNLAARPLRRGRSAAVSSLQRVQRLVPRAAAPVIALQSRLSYSEHFVGRLAGLPPSASTPPSQEQSNGR